MLQALSSHLLNFVCCEQLNTLQCVDYFKIRLVNHRFGSKLYSSQVTSQLHKMKQKQVLKIDWLLLYFLFEFLPVREIHVTLSKINLGTNSLLLLSLTADKVSYPILTVSYILSVINLRGDVDPAVHLPTATISWFLP